MMREELLQRLKQSILNFDVEATVKATKEAVEAGIDPIEAIENGLSKGIREVGDMFACGEAFLPELIMAGEAMKAAVEILKPTIPKGKEIRKLGRIVIGTVAGDLHDIGKTIVSAVLMANGFEVRDLDVDVPAEKFALAVKEGDIDLLGMSALLTSALPEMRKVIEKLKEEKIRDKVKVIIGGAATTQTYANEIGADGWAGDAVSAVVKVKELMGKV